MDNHFPVGLEGFDKRGLGAFIGEKLLLLKWSKSKIQEASVVWRLQLCWEDGSVWHVDNTPMTTKMKDGFEFEIGCIFIKKESLDFECDNSKKTIIELSDFVVKEFRIASACEEGNVSDCAISLIGEKSKEIIISTAIPPTSVAISIFDRVETEFFISDLAWRKLK